MRGIEFLDPVLLAAYACLGIIFAAPVAAQMFAEPLKSNSQALARIAVAVSYGEAVVVVMLALAFATVYATHPHLPIGPDLPGLAMANAFGLASSLAMASIAGLISIRFSPNAARGSMRVIFLGLLVVFFFRSRWLPDVAGAGALLALVVAAVAIAGILRRH